MKRATKEAKVILGMLGLTATDQQFRRAYWRNIKHGPVNGFVIADYLKLNGYVKRIY